MGVGYSVDRVLGGAFGLGLFTNVLACYRLGGTWLTEQGVSLAAAAGRSTSSQAAADP